MKSCHRNGVGYDRNHWVLVSSLLLCDYSVDNIFGEQRDVEKGRRINYYNITSIDWSVCKEFFNFAFWYMFNICR